MEQIPLDLEGKGGPPGDLESLSEEALIALYKIRVEIDPSFRNFDRNTLIEGIKDPGKERDRLYMIDMQEDRDEREQQYHPKRQP